jgi:hypothetical protein
MATESQSKATVEKVDDHARLLDKGWEVRIYLKYTQI